MRQGLFDHHRLDTILISCNAAGVAQKAYGPASEGYCWYLELVTFSVIGNSHTTICDVAVTPDNGDLPAQSTWDHDGLIWTQAAAVIAASQSFEPAVFVDQSHFLHAYGFGGTMVSGDVLQATFQVAVHQLDPQHWMSPEDRNQVREAHERLAEHQVAASAVSGRRAV